MHGQHGRGDEAVEGDARPDVYQPVEHAEDARRGGGADGHAQRRVHGGQGRGAGQPAVAREGPGQTARGGHARHGGAEVVDQHPRYVEFRRGGTARGLAEGGQQGNEGGGDGAQVRGREEDGEDEGHGGDEAYEDGQADDAGDHALRPVDFLRGSAQVLSPTRTNRMFYPG